MHPLVVLAVLALPVACVTWTVTHEDIFREPREWCMSKSQGCRNLVQRKFFYLFTCEFCFSHYVAAGFLVLTRFQLLYSGWRGYVIAEFALVWVANFYMAGFGRLRLELKHERLEIQREEEDLGSKRS
jgi:hypothetical protein